MSWADEHIEADQTFSLHSFTTGKDGERTSERHVRAGRDPADVQHVPDPAFIARTSTLFDKEGKVSAQWVIEKPEDRQRQAVILEWARALTEGLPPVDPIPAPLTTNGDLLTVYPVGDHHMGMLAWKHEVGASYDIEISERLMLGAINHLSNIAPPSEKALIVFLGDFLHYDSMVAETPTNNNPLDADGRFPKMVRAALRTIRYVIERALAKHQFVRVIVEIGNHDLASSIWIMESLDLLYSANERVEIDTSPFHYHYYEFGNCLLASHHGNEAKPAELPEIMAHDRQEAWGRTKYRLWLTGHIHKQSVYDFRGCSVESFRVLAPNDAWAANKGYRSKRDMKALVFHREYGEVGRHIVNPSMLETR